ncbi:MAG: hypothetical protein QF785_11270 [Phycisphaeraceae bacterium]|nr:hypothetical protein [Phycisphaeraceae bacterium]
MDVTYMQFIHRQWAQINAQWSDLPVTTRWLIGTLLIILGLSGYLIVQYAGRSQTVPISQFASQQQQGAIVTRLETAGLSVSTQGNQIHVPVDQQVQALAVLQESELLASDVSDAFDALVKQQNPWTSEYMNRQAFLLAKQKMLGRVISGSPGVRRATVFLSMPDQHGFADNYKHPSASVNVVMQGKGRVNKRLVDGIAGLVSGSIAEMRLQDVVVIDANHGGQFTVKDPHDMAPSATLALLQRKEDLHRARITEQLKYIPGVIVAVNVHSEPFRKRLQRQIEYAQEDQIERERTSNSERSDMQVAVEPGAHAMTGLAIPSGNKSGTSETTSESETNFRPKPIVRETTTEEPGHATKKINVTINVPRQYFAVVHQREHPDETGPLDNASLAPTIQSEVMRIEEDVKTVISTADAPGVVRVSMIPDAQTLASMAGEPVEVSGIVAMLESGWTKPLGLGVLALASLAIMFSMVRKATRAPPLPTVKELTGVPPMPSGDDDELIGEAAESESIMTGIEVDEGEMRVRKVASQISDFVRNDPEEASRLLNRWVQAEAQPSTNGSK